MDEMPDYSRYTLDQLYDVHDHIDREQYPERFDVIVQEIGKRKMDSALMPPEPVPAEPEAQAQRGNLNLEFRGQASEYFRIWIVNLCLTLLTLGIFSAWAKVRKKRYIYSHTVLDGTSFQYLGQPIPILKGRVIAAVLFLVYYAASHFATSLMPYVMGIGVLLAPWIVVRSAAFNARYSAYRNMTFRFHGKYLDACKVLYVWGLVPAAAVAVFFDWQESYMVLGFVGLFFAFAFPWWMRSIKNFIITHTSYGDKSGTFSATGGQFFKVYFISGLIMIVGGLGAALFGAALFGVIKDQLPLMMILLTLPIYAGYILAYAYNQAHIGNLVWNHAKIGPLRFQSSLLGRGLAKLYLTNAFGILASLGALIPWAVMRTLKYRADNMKVFLEGDLAEFKGSSASDVQATGAETMDFFDVDFSI